MDPSTPSRRSARKRPRKTYTVDAFAGLDVPSDLSVSSLSEGEPDADAVADKDQDFTVDDAAQDEAMSGEEATYENGLYDEDDDDDSDGPSRPNGSGVFRTPKRGSARGIDSPGAPGSTSRHTFKKTMAASKQDRYLSFFGTGTQDLINIVKCRDKWGQFVTLPPRQVDGKGQGGFGHSFFHGEEARRREAVEDWEWYDHGEAGERMRKRQKMTVLDEHEGKRYLAHPTEESLDFLLGPYGRHNVTSIPTGGVVNVGDVWKQAIDEHSLGATTHESSTAGSRNAWLLNVGERVQTMDWAPNRPHGAQYLALAAAPFTTPSIPNLSQEATSSSTQPTTAFHPSPPSKSCIQIWSFASMKISDGDSRMDPTLRPRLSVVICTEWGDIRQLKWCPALRKDSRRSEEEGLVELGLLGMVCGDGYTRVVVVSAAEQWGSPTRYIHIASAAFASRPPRTVSTCLDWLSSSHLAAGCANGFVAIWDLSIQSAEPPSDRSSSDLDTTPPSPRPISYQPHAQTYILSLSTCAPSFPSHILTTSMDGYLRLSTPLTSPPSTSSTTAPRSRSGTPSVVWLDALQCAIAAEENTSIRAYPLRRFYSGVVIARPPGGTTTSLSVGKGHTAVMAGGADGSVMCTNPVRKVITHKNTILPWQGKWFQHEWRRPIPPKQAVDTIRPEGRRSAMSRITEGFKLENPLLNASAGNATSSTSTPVSRAKAMMVSPLMTNERKIHEGLVMTTVYEAQTAITATCWNPNMAMAGWAAAGMGSGGLRVEDLAI
ncbi:MAG: hypothetical protein M1817_003003 [Caeruleum heppii]|nr:MAG: hypothetical protein M1817_003003 [Caeruleum heppii]